MKMMSVVLSATNHGTKTRNKKDLEKYLDIFH